MSEWYVSSVAYAALPAWAATTAYTVGQIIRPTAAAITAQYPQRCTTAGTTAGTEAGWTATNNGTSTQGTAVFTNVGGQSAYGWGAAAGALVSISSTRPLAGDRIFLSSDHSESSTTATYSSNGGVSAFGLIQIISVNRAGAVPPGASDISNGATLATSSSVITLDALCDLFWQGITVSSASYINFNSVGTKTHYFKNCTFVLNNAGATALRSSGPVKVIFDNTTVQFGAIGQTFTINTSASPFELLWINTPSAIVGATIPTVLFNNGIGASFLVTCRGVDLSAVTTTLLNSATASEISKVLLDSCKIASGVTRYAMTSTTAAPAYDEIELVNCFDGTNIINERHTPAGSTTTDTSTTLSSGAQDDVGAYSHKFVSSARSDICTMPLDSFWLDVENVATGVSKTATVEIISSAALNNNDIKLQLEYMGTSGSALASFGESLASVLTAAAALGSSSVTWNNPPGTPQKQLLQVTFTPQTAGRVRGRVQLGKVSTTVWVNPQVAIA